MTQIGNLVWKVKCQMFWHDFFLAKHTTQIQKIISISVELIAIEPINREGFANKWDFHINRHPKGKKNKRLNQCYCTTAIGCNENELTDKAKQTHQ